MKKMRIKTSTKQILRYGFAFIIFCLGTVLTIGAFQATHTFEERRIENETERLVHSLMASLQRNLDLTLESIQAMAAYVGASAYITQAGFKPYAQEIRIRSQGVAAVAWISQVQHADKRMFMKTIHRQPGLENFAITELASNGSIVPASQRQRYFPLTYGEPFTDLVPMFGLDMGSQTDWLTVLEKGRDKGKPLATKALPSAQDKPLQIGIFQSIYHSGLPNKLAARRANLRGFIFVGMDLHDVISQALRDLIAKNFTLQVIDNQTGGKILLADAAKRPLKTTTTNQFMVMLQHKIQQWLSKNLSESPRNFATTLTIAGSTWSVALMPNSEFTIAQSAWGVLAGGSALTLLLVAYLLMLMGRTARIERLVADRSRELEESEAHLVQSEKMASIGQMVAGIVHEINTPLAYVRSSVELTKSHIADIADALSACEKLGTQLESDGYTQTEQFETATTMLSSLEEDETLEEAQLLLDNGLSGLDKISDLVTNLKDFSRLDRAVAAEHDINKGLDGALTMINHMLNGKIQTIKHYSDVPHIVCSPAQINQVFLNLLVNAIHAIQAHQDTGTIELTTKVVAGQYVEVSIKDDGKGMSEETLPRVFEPFFTTKRSGKGTGLGLAIAYKIIKEHRGELRVASQVGKGAKFTISLPFKLN